MRDLAALAADINLDLATAKTAEGMARDARLAAAIGIAEAQKRCVADGIEFRPWAAANIHLSAREVDKLLAVGRATDPAAAMRDLRSAACRRQMRSYELRRSVVSEVGTLDGIKRLFGDLSPADKRAFLTWARAEMGEASVTSFVAPPDRSRLMAGR